MVNFEAFEARAHESENQSIIFFCFSYVSGASVSLSKVNDEWKKKGATAQRNRRRCLIYEILCR